MIDVEYYPFLGMCSLGIAFCVLGGIFLIWLFVDFIRAMRLCCMTRTETAQATHMHTYYPQQQQPLPSQPPQQPQQRRRKLMSGLLWKFIVVCFFSGQGISWIMDGYWRISYSDYYVASLVMWGLGIAFCFVGGIFLIWLFVDAIRAMRLCCMTRAETAQAIHMQTYYPPQQQPLPPQPPQQYYPRPQQQQQQQQYGQYQGGMAMGAPTMALNQAASGSGGTGQPEYTRCQVTPGGKPSGPQQPSAPTKGT